MLSPSLCEELREYGTGSTVALMRPVPGMVRQRGFKVSLGSGWIVVVGEPRLSYMAEGPRAGTVVKMRVRVYVERHTCR